MPAGASWHPTVGYGHRPAAWGIAARDRVRRTIHPHYPVRAVEPAPVSGIGHHRRSAGRRMTGGDGAHGLIERHHAVVVLEMCADNAGFVRNVLQRPPVLARGNEGQTDPRSPLEPRQVVHRPSGGVVRHGQRSQHLSTRPDAAHRRSSCPPGNFLLVASQQQKAVPVLRQAADLPAVVNAAVEHIAVVGQEAFHLGQHGGTPFGDACDIFHEDEHWGTVRECLQTEPQPSECELVERLVLLRLGFAVW